MLLYITAGATHLTEIIPRIRTRVPTPSAVANKLIIPTLDWRNKKSILTGEEVTCVDNVTEAEESQAITCCQEASLGSLGA